MLDFEGPLAKDGPSLEEFTSRARELAPRIAQRWAAADAARDVPAETMAELLDSGLMRLFQPQRWGGYEADPRAVFAVQNIIAEACPSTAWVYGVLNVQSLLIGRLGDEVQAEVWGDDDRTLACSSFAPVGVAKKVEGGFRLSGRWSFSSGSSFAGWALVGGRIADAAPPAGPPTLNLFLIPRADYEIKDVWRTFGLRATGSNDLVADDIFVPDRRYVSIDVGMLNVPSAALPRSPLYRMPWQYIFASTISNFAIGAARGALADFVEVARNRVSPFTGQGIKDNPEVKQAVARLAAEIDSAQAMYDRHVEQQLDYVLRDQVIPIRQAILIRTQLSAQLRKFVPLVDELMFRQGARATDLNSRLTRTWLDLMAAKAHAGNDPTMTTTNLGSMLIEEGAG
jgi:3-hydroxy-9,10-secoandrosta-1,3,5(10)-triene-9,17-dione monooxygenase